MVFLIPPGIFSRPAEATGGPLDPWFRRFLIAVTAVLLANGLLILANPTFAAARWPWELNELDARIVAAWFLGWSIWAGTMARVADWDEIRRAAQLFILCGAAILGASLLSLNDFIPGRKTTAGYLIGLAVLTAAMAGWYLVQERRRPARYPGPRP
jgi:hypothetical protein